MRPKVLAHSKVAVVLSLLFSSACGNEGLRQQDPHYYRFPDSLAAQVREVSSSELADAARWSVDPEPLLRMGSVLGEDVFGSVSHAIHLPDGRFIGADPQRDELLVFESDGRFASVWGRPGPGPGEFQRAEWLGFCDGHVYAFDGEMRSVHVFDLDGTHIRTFRPLIPSNHSPSSQPADHIVCNRDGKIGALSTAFASFGVDEPTQIRDGPYRPGVLVGLGDADIGFSAVIRIAGEDRYVFPGGGGTGPWWPVEEIGRTPSVAISRDRLFVATGDAYEIASYSFDGTMARLIRSEERGRPAVTAAAIRAVKTELVSEKEEGDARARLRRTLNHWIWPAYYPMIKGLLVDSRECLWVMDGYPTAPLVRWSVFTPEGEPLGVVDVSGNFRVMQVDEDMLIGHEEDGDGVDYVVAYRYHRRDNRRC